jgi:hypothetical protein
MSRCVAAFGGTVSRDRCVSFCLLAREVFGHGNRLQAAAAGLLVRGVPVAVLPSNRAAGWLSYFIVLCSNL